jgi:hypothetical protein
MANWLDKYNDDVPNAQNGIEGTMGGLTDKGFNYNGAWGGTMQMGGSLPGSAGFTYARTISPAPSNGKYAKKTKASAQTGEAIVKTDTGGGAPDDGYIKLDPSKFSLTTTRGVSETFDPNNAKWKGQSTEWLQKRISNSELLVQAIKDARSLSKDEWQEKYKGASFAAVGEGRAQPILPDFYNDYKKRDDAFIQDWSQARDQAKNELLMQSRWTANKDKAKKEALDFLNQYKGQNELLSSIPTEAAKKYGYTPGELENLSAWDFLSKDAVSKAYYAINANKGFPLPQDPTNEMTCINGICTIESMIGVDFSPMKGAKGVYYDKKTGKTIPQYNPTWLENDNYKKVGYRKLDPREFPQPGDLAQYTDEGKVHHMELVLDNLSKGQGLVVYNNYSQTNDNKPGEGKELRVFNPGTYQPEEFEKTEYFRLTPEAQQKALSRNPTYLKKLESKKAFESSEDYKKFMETQEYIKANQEKYNKFNQLNPQDWRNGGKTSAQNGMEMKYYQEGLDWKPKSISRDGGWLSKYEEGGIIEDPMGQWAHPGEITRIPSNQITMQGVDYPVLGISDTGDTKMMKPGKDYKFKGKSVTEIPMAQRGKIVPLKDLMKQEDEKLKAKSDNTKVVPQKTISNKEANALRARKDAEELARRKQAIATSYAARNKPFSAQQLAEETGAIGDKLRIFPNDPNSFIDEYINPGVMIGNMASALGRAPLDIQQGNYGQAALSVATPLALGAGEAFAQPYIKEAGRVISQQPVVQNILAPIQFRTEKNILKNKFSDIVNRYQTNPEAARRLTETLGITPEELGSPKLQFNPNTGSRYNSTHNYINIDFPEARRLQKLGYDLSDEAILEHEWYHYLQKRAYELSPEYKDLVDEYYNNLDFYNSEKSKVGPLKFAIDNFFSNNPLRKPDYPNAVVMPTSVDYDLLNAFGNPDLIRQPLTRRGADDLEYFLQGSMTEPMPHLGEMRQNMLERGVIQDRYKPITEENVYQFLSNPNGDRISRFASHKNPETIKALTDALKNLSASIPIGVVASTQLPEEKNGGWLNKYK